MMAPHDWGHPRSSYRGHSSPGFSFLETLIAASILLVLATSIIAAGLRSRRQVDYEEVRRRAIVIGQERFETIRSRFSFDDITKGRIDTTIVLDGTTFALRSRVSEGADLAAADSLDPFIKFVTDTVIWESMGWNSGQILQRRVVMGTYYFGGFLEGP